MQGLKRIAPFLTKGAGNVFEMSGNPVAIALTIPNMFELTRGLGPRPSLLGWIRLGLRALRFRPRSGRVILMGVASHLRFSAAGAAILLSMLAELVRHQRNMHFETVEAGWVLEDNVALTRVLVHYNFAVTRTFRIFGKSLSEDVTRGSQDDD
jgi:hypothetical protein